MRGCAGTFRHAITIQEKTLVDDSHGGYVASWSDKFVGPVWCKASQVSGTEKPDKEKVETRAKYKFKTWYRTDIQEIDRVVFNDIPMNIRRIEKDFETLRYMVIHAEEGVQP